MSCIVGLVHEGKGYMGADGQASAYGMIKMALADPKIFKKQAGNDELLIGVIGRHRVSQIVKHELNPPTPYDGQDIEAYMQTAFIPQLKAVKPSA